MEFAFASGCKVRLPDIIFLHKDHFHAHRNRRVVRSQADHIARRTADYAESKIAEYWIIDPGASLLSFTVLKENDTRCMASSPAANKQHQSC